MRERPIRVVLVSSLFPPMYTGAGRQAEAVASRLADSLRTEVLTLGGRGLPPSEVRNGVTVIRMGDAASHRPGRRFALQVFQRLLLWHPRPDVVHALSAGAPTLAAIAACRTRGIPVIVKLTLEGEDDPITVSRRSAGWLRSHLLRGARRIVCPTRRMVELARAAGFPPKRLVHIPNGVDLERFHLPRESQGTERHQPVGRFPAAMVFMGAIYARKGLHHLFADLGNLFRRFPETRLHLVGSGPQLSAQEAGDSYLEELKRQAENPPLRGRVIFEGRTDRPEEILQRCGIFVLPTEAEGLPNSLLEAMACGLASVVTELPALQEVIRPRVNGLLVPANTSGAWVEALSHLLEEPERIRQIGDEARRTVEREYSLERTTGSYLELYRELASAPVLSGEMDS